MSPIGWRKRYSLKSLYRQGVLGAMSFFMLMGCQPIQQKMEPIIIYSPNPQQIAEQPSAFVPLTEDERKQEWAKELIVGDAFARELDLYRALTSYKRARILLPLEAIERRLQIDYDIILCYYLGRKYSEAINTFEESALIEVNALFPAFDNLLIILYDCYRETEQLEKMEAVFQAIEASSPQTAQNLSLYTHLKEGDLTQVREQMQMALCQGDEAWSTYDQYAKSPKKARLLNAILPGAGYYYVGQKKSATTSFIINTLFTAAAYQFFKRGYIAAGLITTSLETGWYLGGINGAGIEAQEFNTRLYEGVSRKVLMENNLFPVLMFDTTF